MTPRHFGYRIEELLDYADGEFDFGTEETQFTSMRQPSHAKRKKNLSQPGGSLPKRSRKKNANGRGFKNRKNRHFNW